MNATNSHEVTMVPHNEVLQLDNLKRRRKTQISRELKKKSYTHRKLRVIHEFTVIMTCERLKSHFIVIIFHPFWIWIY